MAHLTEAVLEMVVVFASTAQDGWNMLEAAGCHGRRRLDTMVRCLERIIEAGANAQLGPPEFFTSQHGCIDVAGRILDNWLAPFTAGSLTSAAAGAGAALVRGLAQRCSHLEAQQPEVRSRAAVLRRALATSVAAQIAARAVGVAQMPAAHPTVQAWLEPPQPGPTTNADRASLATTAAHDSAEWAVSAGGAVVACVVLRRVATSSSMGSQDRVQPGSDGSRAGWPWPAPACNVAVQRWLERVLLGTATASRTLPFIRTAEHMLRVFAGDHRLPTLRRTLDLMTVYMEAWELATTRGGGLGRGRPLSTEAADRFMTERREDKTHIMLHAVHTAVVVCGADAEVTARLARAAARLLAGFGIPLETLVETGLRQDHIGSSGRALCELLRGDGRTREVARCVMEMVASDDQTWPLEAALVADRLFPRQVWRAIWNATGANAELPVRCGGAVGALLVGRAMAIPHADVARIFDHNAAVLHPATRLTVDDITVMASVLEADHDLDPEARRIVDVAQLLALVATRGRNVEYMFMSHYRSREEQAAFTRLKQGIAAMPGPAVTQLLRRCIQWYVDGADPQMTDRPALDTAMALMKYGVDWDLPGADLLAAASMVVAVHELSRTSFVAILAGARLPGRVLQRITERLPLRQLLEAALARKSLARCVIGHVVKIASLTPTSPLVQSLPGPSLLVDAVRRGDTDAVRLLLKAGFDSHSGGRPYEAGVPLIMACCADTLLAEGIHAQSIAAIVRALVAAGADPNWRRGGLTAMEVVSLYVSKRHLRQELLCELRKAAAPS